VKTTREGEAMYPDDLTPEQHQALVRDNVWFLRKLFYDVLVPAYPPETTLTSGITQSEAVLFCEYENKNLTVSALARKIGKPRSSAQKALDRMEEGGFLEFYSDHTDGRKKRFRLTPKGKQEARKYDVRLIRLRLDDAQRMLSTARRCGIELPGLDERRFEARQLRDCRDRLLETLASVETAIEAIGDDEYV
jgi:DNA-binding MarR family transcriptional regulator